MHIGRWVNITDAQCPAGMSLPTQMDLMYRLVTRALLLGVRDGCRIVDDVSRIDFRWRFQ